MSSFVELMRSVPPPFNMVVYIMLIVCGSGVLTSVFKQIRKFACHRQELDFKRELLDRGMSAEEVAQVIQATPESDNGKCFNA
ncbi:MAG: hypothetical protein GXP24_09030 [Planctomycetes bacterium]|nr:hypothetical protein [Planctomycetota bacterium]